MNKAQAIAAILALAALLTGPRAVAQQYESAWPDSEPAITSAILSRTSITVRSIEESLKLYRDILGFTPLYNRTGLSDPRLLTFSGLKEGQTMRLVVLRTETDGPAKLNAGYLGLSEIHEADGSLAPLVEPGAAVPTAGAMGLVLIVRDVLDIHAKVKAGGYDILSAPIKREDGRVTQLLMRGPSGERLWLSQGSFPTVFIQKKAG